MSLTAPLLRNCEDTEGMRYSMAHSWLYRHTGGLALAASAGFWLVAATLLYLAI